MQTALKKFIPNNPEKVYRVQNGRQSQGQGRQNGQNRDGLENRSRKTGRSRV